jgi:two-component system sensor histidine kinase PilS (NtrC family)
VDRRLPPGESWFGAFDSAAPAHVDSAPAPHTRRARDTVAPPTASSSAAADSRFMARQAQRLVDSGTVAFERMYRSFMAARAVVGVLLVLTQAAVGLSGTHSGSTPALLSVIYGAQALLMWLLPRIGARGDAAPVTRLSRRRWLATVGFDLVCFSTLHLIERKAVLNYDALLLLPVLMSAVLMPRRRALATTAAAALFLLGVAALEVSVGGDAVALLTPAGLVGGGLFFVTLLAGELAGRLAREEQAARGSLELARQQAQLNRLVLEEMTDGVLVVDRRGRVRAANPAARLLLGADGMCRPAPFPLKGVDAWLPLVRAVERAFIDGQWPEAGRDVTLELAPSLQRTLRLRVRFTRRRDAAASEDVCLIFVEDVLNLQARLRQEKLAAMGRVSAGIAHEIRNPLAAIAQANALLAEDTVDPAQRRLTSMVADNVERLKRIVDDVLEVAPAAVPDVAPIDCAARVGALTGEWAGTAGIRLGEQSVLQVFLPAEPLGTLFDAEHLRRVLVNLLDNARRHGSGSAGAVRVVLSTVDERQAQLSVASDGAPIPPEVERYLFEPFFSTRSRGTGLGLYICRELCERYGARIEYRQHGPDAAHRNEFVVTMRRAALPAQESRSLHLVS